MINSTTRASNCFGTDVVLSALDNQQDSMLNKETLSISFCVHQKFCGNKYVVTEPDFSADSQTEPNI